MKSNDKLYTYFKKYTENKVLRATISLIPHIGGALDILISTDIHKKNIERFDFLINELKNQIEDINESKLNYSYLDSEEFYDLFIQTCNLAIKTRLKEKIKLYSKILKSSLINEFSGHLKPEDLLNIIEDLTANDIQLIKTIFDYLKSAPKFQIDSEIVFSSSSLIKAEKYSEEYIFIGLLRLEKQSIIMKNARIVTDLQKTIFSPTPLFNIIIEFLMK